MSKNIKNIPQSTVDTVSWPTQLTAGVVEPGPSPRVHGYDAEDDLARHYSFVDTLVLALTGELPEPATSRAVEIVLQFLIPLGVNEGPAHVGVLSRLFATSVSASLSLIAITAAEKAEMVIKEHQSWVAWLDDPINQDYPSTFNATSAEEKACVARLLAALPAQAPGRTILRQRKDISRFAALIAILHQAGLRSSCHLEAILLQAWLPCAAAEAFRVKPASFADYPMNLPPIRYRDEKEEF